MKKSACTTVLVGKKASMTGSVMIARNEDFGDVLNLKTFRLQPASEVAGRTYTSENTKVVVSLPERAYRCTSTPSDDPKEIGVYAESGINEKNVAMSATESLYGNERVLALDPLVAEGIAEDALNDIVLPFIDSARHGVEFLGKLIAEHGSAEGNGILFADVNEAWYMEIPTGHHWVAVRIPDDCYAVAPNHVCIERVNFNDADNFITSEGLEEFVRENDLNPDYEGFNFRHIFGTYTELDRIYNTPRAWDAVRYLNPSLEVSPTSGEIPFILKPERRVAVEDVAKILSSHFNETPYDPIGKGSEEDKKRFRAISLSRTQESHILELRNGVEDGVVGIHRLAFGTTAFTPYVPFFSNVSDTPPAWRDMTQKLSLDNAYWVFKLLSYYTEEHRTGFLRDNVKYLEKLNIYFRKRVKEVTEEAKGKSGEELTRFLTEENQKTADEVMKVTKELLQDFATRALNSSKMSFKMEKDL